MSSEDSDTTDGFVWGSRSECGRCGVDIDETNRHELKIYGPGGYDERLGYYCEKCASRIAEGK